MSDFNLPSSTKPLKLLAGTAVAALLIGWAAGVGAQTANPMRSAAAGVTAGEPARGKRRRFRSAMTMCAKCRIS